MLRRRTTRFSDRRAAGRELADSIGRLPAVASAVAGAGQGDVIVVGLPRGGVPVADEVARHLGTDLDVIVVRKVGAPGHEELAIGAVAPGGVEVRNADVIAQLGLSDGVVDRSVAGARVQLDDRVRRFGSGVRTDDIAGRTVIVVDDGVATGATIRAAIAVVRAMGAASVIAALPVGPPDTIGDLEQLADDVVCLASPTSFQAVGGYYGNFDQTTDREVTSILDRYPPR